MCIVVRGEGVLNSPVLLHILLNSFEETALNIDCSSQPVTPASLSWDSTVVDHGDGVERQSISKRGVLPKQATQIMKSWLFQHLVVSVVSTITHPSTLLVHFPHPVHQPPLVHIIEFYLHFIYIPLSDAFPLGCVFLMLV